MEEQNHLDEVLEIVKQQCDSFKIEDLLVDFKSVDGCQIITIPTIGKPIKFIHEDL